MKYSELVVGVFKCVFMFHFFGFVGYTVAIKCTKIYLDTYIMFNALYIGPWRYKSSVVVLGIITWLYFIF